MDDDAILLFGLGLGLWLVLRNQNRNPGAFSPYAPDYGQGWQNAIIPQTVSSSGRDYIKAQEQFRLYPYPDAGGYSIYYGHFIQPGETFNNTQAEGDAIFNNDLAPIETAINQNVSVPINQNQFDALADFIYNEGIGAFKSSTLLQILNSGDYQGAAQQFSRWVYSSGRVNPDLQARRQQEQQQFQS